MNRNCAARKRTALSGEENKLPENCTVKLRCRNTVECAEKKTNKGSNEDEKAKTDANEEAETDGKN